MQNTCPMLLSHSKGIRILVYYQDCHFREDIKDFAYMKDMPVCLNKVFIFTKFFHLYCCMVILKHLCVCVCIFYKIC